MTPEAKAKWRETMSIVGDDGLTGFQRRGQAIRAAKLAKNPNYDRDHAAKMAATLVKKDEDGISGYQKRGQSIAASVDREKRGQAISKTLQEKRKKDPTDREKLKWYRGRVALLSRKHDLSLLENFDKWNVRDGYELEHKFSVKAAFDLGLTPEVVSQFHNLCFMPKIDNVRKGMKCSITLNELISGA